ncbi:MAG: FG-GAP-like repeat-containing protein [Flavobacteriales bacterium]
MKSTNQMTVISKSVNYQTTLLLIFSCLLVYTSVAQRFAAIGDFGSGNENAAAVADLIEGWEVDFIITLGDNNYPSGAASTIDDHIGQFYSDYIFPYSGQYSSSATQNNFYPALGNHEYYTEGAIPHLEYFELPGNERYYDYVRGNVHFFVLNSDIAEEDGIDEFSIQAQWLQTALENSNSTWNVVYMHEPPYTSGLHDPLEAMRWPFQEWGADAVLSGDNHQYERTFVDCVPYFVNGLGGGVLHSYSPSNAETAKSYFGQYGAMLMEASAEELNFQFWNIDGELIDDYSIYADDLNPNPYHCFDVISSSGLLHSKVLWNDTNGDLVKDAHYTTGGTLFYAENLADGSFSQSMPLLESSYGMDLISMTDINSDQTLDYLLMINDATSDENSKFVWLLMDTDNQVLEQTEILNPSYSGAIDTSLELILVSDINSDNLLDIVWVEFINCTVRCNMNLGNGTFSSDQELFGWNCDELVSIQPIHISENTHSDILVTTSEQGTYWVENLGDGSFSQETVELINNEYTQRLSPIILDIDSDGDSDLILIATNESTSNEVFIFLENNGQEEFILSEVGTFSIENIIFQETLQKANMDGDEFYDVLIKDNSSILWFEYEDGTFTQVDSFPAPWSRPFLAADINADGLDDIVHSEGFFKKIGWKENPGGTLDDTKTLIETSSFYTMRDLFFQNTDVNGGIDIIFRPVGANGQHLFFYKNQFEQLAAPINPGDFNSDNAVNVMDLSVLLAYFGEPCPNEDEFCLPDLSQDGEVTVQDLGQFLALFGTTY